MRGRRSPLTDLAGLALGAWGLLLGYVSLPPLLSHGPLWDGGISVLGALLAAGHLGAAVGVMRRNGWGRGIGLWMAAIGLFGSAAVLITLAQGVLGRPADDVGLAIGLPLAIPAAMVAVYGFIVVALLRARQEFDRESP